VDSQRYEIDGVYHLSNLLQNLAIARDSGRTELNIAYEQLDEPPVHRLSRMIKTYYWDGLTRRMDKKGLKQILIDPKMKESANLYIPHNDPAAWQYYSAIADELDVNVIRLPERITPQYVESLNTRPGLLTLAADTSGGYTPLPFVVPGGRFNEMYGWDSYFINIGLLLSGRIQLARFMVDHFIYQINHYGKILNANRTYYLTRSQPPFLTSMVSELYTQLDKNPDNRKWLKHALITCIKEYNTVWMAEPHLTKTGLSRYFGTGIGIPPETEPDHFDEILLPYAEKAGMSLDDYKRKYMNNEISEPALTQFFINDRAMRESGHDTSNRLINICAHLNTVALNALLYKYETDIARLIKTEFNGELKIPGKLSETPQVWNARAEKRKKIMDRLMWDENSAQYYDYNFVKEQKTQFQSLTNLYPLWAGMVSQERAELMVTKALPLYIEPGGLVSTTKASRGPVTAQRPQRQWDYPNGWAPHQILIWTGLQNYGYNKQSQQLAYRWLYMITRNAVDYNGTIPEKYNVVERTHKVFAEYGNVGTQFDYITKEGFGWMNASYLKGLSILTDPQIENLNNLIPPEWIQR
jgi:alpha,alpha-trehalase